MPGMQEPLHSTVMSARSQRFEIFKQLLCQMLNALLSVTVFHFYISMVLCANGLLNHMLELCMHASIIANMPYCNV